MCAGDALGHPSTEASASVDNQEGAPGFGRARSPFHLREAYMAAVGLRRAFG